MFLFSISKLKEASEGEGLKKTKETLEIFLLNRNLYSLHYASIEDYIKVFIYWIDRNL